MLTAYDDTIEVSCDNPNDAALCDGVAVDVLDGLMLCNGCLIERAIQHIDAQLGPITVLR